MRGRKFWCRLKAKAQWRMKAGWREEGKTQRDEREGEVRRKGAIFIRINANAQTLVGWRK